VQVESVAQLGGQYQPTAFVEASCDYGHVAKFSVDPRLRARGRLAGVYRTSARCGHGPETVHY
jgi:hypothetical protein